MNSSRTRQANSFKSGGASRLYLMWRQYGRLLGRSPYWLALIIASCSASWVFIGSGASASALPGTTQLVAGPSSSLSASSSVSDSGRYVSFISNGHVYRLDRLTNTTTMVDVAPDGTPGDMPNEGYSPASDQAMSSDGGWIVFVSHSNNLLAGINGQPSGTGPNAAGVYLRDLNTDITERVDISSNDQVANSAPQLGGISVSNNGKYVAFASSATNLSSAATGGQTNVFRKDMTTGDISLISEPQGSGGSNGSSSDPQISVDGKTVLFGTAATNLTTAVSPSGITPLLWTQKSGVKPLPAYAPNGSTSTYVPVDAGGYDSLSGNGQVVSYYATLANDQNTWTYLIYDRLTGAITQAPYWISSGELSYDGSEIAYEEQIYGAITPESSQAPGVAEVYSTNLTTGVTNIVSINNDDEVANESTGLYLPCCAISGALLCDIGRRKLSSFHFERNKPSSRNIIDPVRSLCARSGLFFTEFAHGYGSKHPSPELYGCSPDTPTVDFGCQRVGRLSYRKVPVRLGCRQRSRNSAFFQPAIM